MALSQVQKNNTFLCDTLTGSILCKINGAPEKTILQENQILVDAGDLDPTEYFYNKFTQSIQKKYDFVDGEFVGDYYTINLPSDCLVVWQGVSYVVEDGTLEILIDQPEAHDLFLWHSQYIPKVLKIEN